MSYESSPRTLLVRRSNHFIQESSIYEKVAVAFDVISVIVGIVLVFLAIIALSRSAGHRVSFVVVLFGTVFYLLSHALELAYRLLQYDDDAISSGSSGIRTIVGLNIADAVFTNLTDVVAILAAILVLWNRQASFVFAHPTERPVKLKRVLDVGLIVLLVIFAVAPEALIGDAQIAYYNENISYSTLRSRYITAFNLQHAYTAFVFLAIVNVIGTAVLLRSNISRVDSKRGDSPTNTILFALVPLLLIHWAYFLFQHIWYSSHFINDPSGPTNPIIGDVSVVECMILPACIAIVLIALGIRHRIWNTFGDQPVSGGPVFYPSQTQQYYVPQQQQHVYGQPLYGQQTMALNGQHPAYGQQPEQPEQGEMRWKA